jgi:hypothetical protein
LQQYVGAVIVAVGIIIVLLPTFRDGTPQGAKNPIMWSFVLIFSCVPMCLSRYAADHPVLYSHIPICGHAVHGGASQTRIFKEYRRGNQSLHSLKMLTATTSDSGDGELLWS